MLGCRKKLIKCLPCRGSLQLGSTLGCQHLSRSRFSALFLPDLSSLLFFFPPLQHAVPLRLLQNKRLKHRRRDWSYTSSGESPSNGLKESSNFTSVPSMVATFFFDWTGGANLLLIININKKDQVYKRQLGKKEEKKIKLRITRWSLHKDILGFLTSFALRITQANSFLNRSLTEAIAGCLSLKMKSFLSIQMHNLT
jgi:hypothetical protein